MSISGGELAAHLVQRFSELNHVIALGLHSPSRFISITTAIESRRDVTG